MAVQQRALRPIRTLTICLLFEYPAIEIDFHNVFQPRTARSAALPRVTAPCPFVIARGLGAGRIYDCGTAYTVPWNAAHVG